MSKRRLSQDNEIKLFLKTKRTLVTGALTLQLSTNVSCLSPFLCPQRTEIWRKKPSAICLAKTCNPNDHLYVCDEE
jgi:hypothetical protein